MTTIQLTSAEVTLLCEALRRSAKRQESEARYDPRNAKPHEQKAAGMRRLAEMIETADADDILTRGRKKDEPLDWSKAKGAGR